MFKDRDGRGISRCVSATDSGLDEEVDGARPGNRLDGSESGSDDAYRLDLAASSDSSSPGDGVAATADAPSDLPSGTDAPTDRPPTMDAGTLKTNGSACGAPSECLHGNCIENVCCDSGCTGKCQSCLAVNTGRTNGTCAPVTSGKDPDDECTATPASGCGDDGWCDGQGKCRQHDANTICQAESCTNNGTSGATHTPARKCTGMGSCAPAMTSTCGNFLCSGSVSCASSCQSTTDCASNAYCQGRTCVPKKSLGSVCSDFQECATGICGGRCCSSSCTCPQPSTTNLLKNPGFEKDLSGWSDYNAQWTGEDADGCPFSGSARPLAASGDPSQCVTLAPGKAYRLGAMFKAQPDGILVCYMLFHATPDCTGPRFGHPTMDYPSISGRLTTWSFEAESFETPQNALSGFLQCEGYNAVVDKLFVSPGDGGF